MAQELRRPVIEVIDLSSDSDEDSVIGEPNQTEAPVRQQNEAEDPRLSHLKCVICLDSPTDLTATNCGHLFCHECITAALRVTSATSGVCPVCRRKTTLKSLIPLAILKGNLLGELIDPTLQEQSNTSQDNNKDPQSRPATRTTPTRKSSRKRKSENI